MLARIAAFVAWGLVTAALVFWGLRLLVQSQPAPAYATAVSETAAVHGDMARLLGSSAATLVTAAANEPALASRFKLLGLMAGRSDTDPSLALIAVDGKPARPYRVGTVIDGDLVLQSVSLRSAAIGAAQGAAAFTLDMPALPIAATGRLSVSTEGGAAPMPTPVQAVPAMPAPAPALSPQPTAPTAAPPSATPGGLGGGMTGLRRQGA